MRSKLIALFASSIISAHASTNVTLQVFNGTEDGSPIVDNTGVPIDASLASWSVGTFSLGFALTLPTLDTLTDDQHVLDNFTAVNTTDGNFSLNGLFNGSVSADEGNAAVSANVFALVEYASPDGLQVLVFNVSQPFPEQDAAGNASLDIGRILVASDVSFGNRSPVEADPSTLPEPFAGFTTGVTFDVVPEPSTSFLSLLAGFIFLASRRR